MSKQINRIFAIQKKLMHDNEMAISALHSYVQEIGHNINLRTLQRDMIVLMELDENIKHIFKSRNSYYIYEAQATQSKIELVNFQSNRLSNYYIKDLLNTYLSNHSNSELKKYAKKLTKEYPEQIFVFNEESFAKFDDQEELMTKTFLSYIQEENWIQIDYRNDENEIQSFKAYPKYILAENKKIKAIVYLPLLNSYYTLELSRIVESRAIKAQKYSIPDFDLREFMN